MCSLSSDDPPPSYLGSRRLLVWPAVPAETCATPCLPLIGLGLAEPLRPPAIAALMLLIYGLLAVPVGGYACAMAIRFRKGPNDNTRHRLHLLERIRPTAWLLFLLAALIVGTLFFFAIPWCRVVR